MFKTNFIKENDLCSLICNKYSIIKNNDYIEVLFTDNKMGWEVFSIDIEDINFQQFLVNKDYYLICIHKQLTDDEFQSKELHNLIKDYISGKELIFNIRQAEDDGDVILKKSINDIEIYVTENKELVINLKHELDL